MARSTDPNAFLVLLALTGGVALLGAFGLLLSHGTWLDMVKGGGFLHGSGLGFALVIGIGALAALLLLWQRVRK